MASGFDKVFVARARETVRAHAGGLLVKGTRRRLTAVAHLLSGNFLNALIMLVSVAIAARSLGVAAYGIMVMVL
ncbi:MAG: lipopolysaccharide biosynthesis protein, partial [Sphingomonas sp.]|nr:lipopolysaccharide biosynthesis protein [Sphingomonas sp.]